MSMSVSIVIVPFENLKSLIGSRNEEVGEEIASEFEEFMCSFDEAFEDLIASGEVRRAMNAVKDLLTGGALVDDRAHSLRFAVWLLSQHVGRTVDLESFAEMHSSFLREADRVFESIGISKVLTIDTLLGRGLPKEIGFEDHEPFESGYLTSEECQEIDKLVSDAAVVHNMDRVNPQVAAGVEELIDTIKMVASEGSLLLCFIG